MRFEVIPMFTTALLVSATSTADAKSVAFLSGNNLLELCESSDERFATCIGYVVGVADTLASKKVSVTVDGGQFSLCLREGVEPRQVVDAVIEYVKANPGTRDFPAPQSVEIALFGAFGCMQKP